MTQTKTVAVEVDDRNIQRPWDESDLVTDWSAFPRGYGILLNERLMFPEDLCLWRMKMDTTRQLFVDDYLIAHQRELKREFHSPQDHPANPLMTPCIPTFVGPDEEHGYRLYYDWHAAQVAFSRDGLHWDKPNLDICERPAGAPPDQPNNSIAIDRMFGLLCEPDDPNLSQRWKAISGPQTRITWPYAVNPVQRRPVWLDGPKTPPPPEPLQARAHDLYVSPDGLRWTRKSATSLPKSSGKFVAPYDRPTGIGDCLRVRWDPKLNKYMAFTKHTIGPDLRMSPVFHEARVAGMCESDDLIHWSSPRIYAYPDGEDAKMPGMYGIYEADGFPYESMWFNHFSMSWYHPASEEESRQRNLMPTRPYIKRNRIRLAGSRDGRHWYYLGDRRTFIELGPEGSWKPHYLRMVNRHTVGGPLLKDDELWFYYRGSNTDGPKTKWAYAMGVATLRRDGFASLNAGEEAGVVITRPLVFEGEGKLFVNADVAANGCIRASVVAEDGSAIEGFGEDDCRAVCADSTRSRVGWSGNETLAGLKDRYIRLAFHLTNAKLYSFWIE